tara:strand:- start:7426 stop:8058 length:633 start_codon:yes stop_codon:yes gene_type:complete
MNNNSKKIISLNLEKNNSSLSEDEKIKAIAKHFRSIMEILNLDLTDNSLRDTPNRVAKMYVKELFDGLDPNLAPSISKFENSFEYNGCILEKNIPFYSLCEHHFVPIKGVAHVAYYANEKIIGLSKINRIVNYLSKKPQVQEKLTVEIVTYLKNVLQTEDVACVLEAEHLCVSMRGIKDVNSLTTTAEYSGKFKEPSIKLELLSMINKDE